ncbi:MAG: ABC transporter substrate-binding protein [Tannerellaceae bacterium]|nr:ABC transporter substrate-binding protein [Tannerellaceae bacterium]
MLNSNLKFLLLVMICLASACSRAGKSSPNDAVPVDIRHAKGLCVSRSDDYVTVEITDPWNADKLLQRYILIERSKSIPEKLPQGTVIRTPIRRLAVYTAVHAAMIEELDETQSIIGVCEPDYITLPSIKRGIADGTMADLGMSSSPNIEKMLDTGVEYIIATPFQNADYGAAGKTGIPIIEGADYMEITPLGRAEWIRFFGLLFCKEAKADSIFSTTESQYTELKALVSQSTSNPTVLSEQKYGSSWYVPGHDSYIANFFRDAGATYLFDDVAGTGSVPLSFETVLDRAIHADIWLIKYNSLQNKTYRELRGEYSLYEKFDAFKNRNIFTCNTGSKPYYEESPVHPDYLLRDYIHIFHPDILPDYILKYYERMQE